MKDTFNLAQLRSDVGAHLADQYPGSYTLIHPDFQPLNVLDWDHLVDFVIAALIGDFMFMAMYHDPALSFTTFDLGLSYPGDPAY